MRAGFDFALLLGEVEVRIPGDAAKRQYGFGLQKGEFAF